MNPDAFKRFRLQHGVYGQRQADVQMVRVKIPWGGLRALQLERLAEVAGRTPRPGERFEDFVGRIGAERVKATLAPWTELRTSADAPDKYTDWGATESFKLETGAGECAA